MAANSSTTIGPQGLAGESCGRRCRTANGSNRWVRGCFYVRPPEICGNRRGKLCRVGRLGHTAWTSPGERDSDVIRKMKEMTNAGTSAAAGVVSGAWISRPGDSNAVEGECGPSRSRSGDRAMLRQGSRNSFARSGWCWSVSAMLCMATGACATPRKGLKRGACRRGAFATTKGLTGSMYLSM